MPRKNSSNSLVDGILASGLLRPGDRILVAVSGGPDSTALLVAIHELGFDATAAHFDHALRAGSDKVGDQVAALCRRLGVGLVAARRESPMRRGSIQAGARALRYGFFEGARRQVGANVVALGHTADDLVEGAVLHLMRGCGLAGLRGMPAKREPYARPMLAVWRREVVEFLAQRGIVAYEDPANSELKFARARLRHQILPALERDRPGIIGRFYAAARRASSNQETIERHAHAVIRAGIPSRWDVAKMPEAVGAEVMKLLYVSAGGDLPALSRSHLGSMLELARGKVGGRGVDLPGGRRFRIVGDHMEVIGAGAPGVYATWPQLDVRQCNGCDDTDATHLKADLRLSLGFRSPGLRMRPVGGRGSRKLQDILVDARVPREDRDSWPLVFAGDRLAWVPGVAVDADLMSVAGEPSLHVGISPMPDRWKLKVASLGTPISPRGESS
jgi:tRNA(Ile)-lysidine synthase